MVSGSSELGIDGLAQRSSSVTSQARLKAHVWVMSLPGLALIASCHLSRYLFHAATLPSLYQPLYHPITREVPGSHEGMTFAFSLVTLIFGCTTDIMCYIISLKSANEFQDGGEYARHPDLIANPWVLA